MVLVFNTTLFAMSDYEIVTEYDQKYCSSNQKIKNANISPYDLADNGQVWRIGNRRWTQDYEYLYSQWVETQLNDSFLIDLGIKADCADIVFFARAVFARMNNLPFSIQGIKASNFQTKWKDLDSTLNWNIKDWKSSYNKDKRFQAALHEWSDRAGQYHLQKDIYPIKIIENKSLNNQLKSGQVLISPGHASIVNIQKGAFLPYKLTTSKIPAEIRVVPLVVRGLLEGYSFNSWKAIANCNGKFKTVSSKKMKNYSTNFDEGFGDKDILEKIQGQLRNQFNPGISKEDETLMAYNEVKSLISTLKLKIKERVSAIDSGYQEYKGTSATDYFESKGKMVYGREGKVNIVNLEDFKNKTLDYLTIFPVKNDEARKLYYDHSTPSRDLRLRDLMTNTFKLISYLDDEKVESVLTELIEYEFNILESEKLSIYHVFQTNLLSPFSSQPWDHPRDRWLAKDYAHIQPGLKPIEFLEERFYQGKKILNDLEARSRLGVLINKYFTSL